MASDSRVTLNSEQITPDGKKIIIAVGMSDSNYKTFLTPFNIGISAFGQAEIIGVPIAGTIETFIQEQITEESTVTEVANKINKYFQTFTPIPKTGFHVAGFEKTEKGIKQKVYRIAVDKNEVILTNPDDQKGLPGLGASWDGEGDIIGRLFTPVYKKESDGNYKQIPPFQVPFQFFTLQDAIDFAVYAIRTTIDSVRFLPRAKTVGGPIDVLVIKSTEAFWVSRKTLVQK